MADHEQGGGRGPGAPRKHDIDQGRRAFFRAIVPTLKETPQLPAQDAPGGGSVYPQFVPSIDPALCNGCDACLRVCASEAIVLARDDATLCYEIRATKCTGCDLCRDVCETGAMRVESGSAAGSGARVLLVEGRCMKCGAPFHHPRGVSDDRAGDVCRICARVDHRRRLFQVQS